MIHESKDSSVGFSPKKKIMAQFCDVFFCDMCFLFLGDAWLMAYDSTWVSGSEEIFGFSRQLEKYITPWKFNSSPLKICHPKRKIIFQHLPTIIFQGRAVKLGGVAVVSPCGNPTRWGGVNHTLN